MKNQSRLLLAAAGLCLSQGVMAEGSLSIGVEDLQYLPYYTTTNGNYTGFARELFDDYANTTSTDVTLNPLPIKRLYKSFFEGEVQAKFPDSPYWAGHLKEGKDMLYSNEVVSYIDGVMIKGERDGMTKSSLKNLATVRGFTAWDYMPEIEAGQIKVSENSGFEATLKQVAAGRADGAYVNIAVAEYTLMNVLNKPDALIFAPELPHTLGFYYVSTIGNSDVINSLNKFMEDRSGEIETLKSKYDLVLDYN
jgi:ABC-type amino acid transport substrate-binding protein